VAQRAASMLPTNERRVIHSSTLFEQGRHTTLCISAARAPCYVCTTHGYRAKYSNGPSSSIIYPPLLEQAGRHYLSFPNSDIASMTSTSPISSASPTTLNPFGPLTSAFTALSGNKAAHAVQMGYRPSHLLATPTERNPSSSTCLPLRSYFIRPLQHAQVDGQLLEHSRRVMLPLRPHS
jgi:hypothetical protein